MRLDERGKQCPLPVVETKRALEAAGPGETVEVVVDNEIAVQNLRKMADHKGLEFRAEKTGEREFTAWVRTSGSSEGCPAPVCCPPAADGGIVAVISSGCMGQGDDTLGKLLMKGFVYALSQQEQLPRTVLLYNGGAFLSCEGSDSVEDLRELEAQGVEILTCGTCLNHYGLEGKLQVGGVTNMYEIAERMTGARLLVRP